MQKALIAVMVVAGALVIGAGSAQTAANFSCNGSFTGGTYNNVTVPANAHCSLDHTRVLGSITVKTNAQLLFQALTGDSTVKGNVSAQRSRRERLQRGDRGRPHVQRPPAFATNTTVAGNTTGESC